MRYKAASICGTATRGKWAISALAACALSVVALPLPAAAVADSAATSTTVAVRPGPLALYGVPVGRSFRPLVMCTRAGMSASLPAIRVVDATGSGRGWHVAIAVTGGGEASIRAAVSAYNGPAELRPRSTGEVKLAPHPRRVAYALRDQGMGTTVLSGIAMRSHPGVRVRFFLEPGP